VVTLGDVLFDTGKANLKSGAIRSLERVADALKSNPERRVTVEGFTDSTGSEQTNLELSQRRAEAVERALEQMGVDTGRIAARGYGEEFPVADNDSASGRQMNRRVEIIISDEHGPLSGLA
jgi:outer membrane protein OmpA-like peptidoglycan-associated protein